MPNVFRFRRTSVPPEPNRNSEAVYAAADGTLKQVAPDGSETDLGGGGGGSQSLSDVLVVGNDAAGFGIFNLDDPFSGQDAATKAYVDDNTIPQGGPLTEDLVAGDTSASHRIVGASQAGGDGGVIGVGPADGSGDGGNSALDGGQGAAGRSGGVASLDGGSGDAGNTSGASVQAQAGTATVPGRLFVYTDAEVGAAGQALVSDGAAGVVWGGIQITAGPPTSPGDPPTGLPFAYDTTSVTGGFYFWNGAAWVKIANIL